jgi:flap endonuclease-1
MCILCGCDYCPSIKGIGAKTALSLVQKHGSIERVLEVRLRVFERLQHPHRRRPCAHHRRTSDLLILFVMQHLDPAKYPLPQPYPYQEARQLFRQPAVLPADQLPPMRWAPPDEPGLVAFLCGEKQFSEERVRSAVKRIQESKGKANQGRLESFFGPVVKKVHTAWQALWN